MKKTKKILLPTDLSDASFAAMEYIHELACLTHDYIYIIHVIEDRFPALSPQHQQWENGPLGCMHQLQKKISDLLSTNLSRHDNIACVIRRGDAAAEILKFAGEEKIDLIVMTTHGEGYLTERTIGSIAERILHDAKVPVIVIQSKHTHFFDEKREEFRS